jgi:hypothetical protein
VCDRERTSPRIASPIVTDPIQYRNDLIGTVGWLSMELDHADENH